jgi:hypothetical protein
MPRKNKRKLSEYDLAVRVVFEEISGWLDTLVAMQEKYEGRHSREEYQSEPEKQIVLPKKSGKLAV